MTHAATESNDGRGTRIRFPDRFDFSFHNEFRRAYETAKNRSYILDMRDTSYIDSAALGMLLQLHEYCGNDSQAIRVVNAGSGIKEVLKIANFHKLMVIE